MKITRNKKIRRTLQFYEMNFSFESPYSIILEESFIRQAIKLNLPSPIVQLLKNFINDQEATICTTQCILNNLEKRGEKAKREYEFAKSLTIVDCKHKDEPLSSYKCCCNIASYMHLPNKAKYIFATEFDDLKNVFRAIPGVPLIFFNRSVLVLEPPSSSSLHIMEKRINQRLEMSEKERKSLGLLQLKEEKESKKPKKKKGPKGPNPLSVKKKKNPVVVKTTETKKKTRRNNKKKLLMKQMKEMNGQTDSTPAAPEATEHPVDVQENSAN